MKTIDDVIKYLESELADYLDIYDQAKGKDPQQAYASLIKVATIEQLIDGIKQQQVTSK